jgi:hypothetical protein
MLRSRGSIGRAVSTGTYVHRVESSASRVTALAASHAAVDVSQDRAAFGTSLQEVASPDVDGPFWIGQRDAHGSSYNFS